MNTEQIWIDFRYRLKGFIIKRVRSEHDAEDILQDVFTKVHQKLPNLKDEGKLESWLFQITRNAITDYYRRSQPLIDVVPDLSTDKPDELDRTLKELSGCLKPLIENLSEKYRHAIDVTSYQELTQQALANELGLSLSAAKSRVQRARKQLKTQLLSCCKLEYDNLGNIMDYQSKQANCQNC